MPELNDAAAVRAQYGTSGNLSTRISIHEKYSVNKQGFGNWITEHYRLYRVYGFRMEEGSGRYSVHRGDLSPFCLNPERYLVMF